jgi:hypothetical protein
MPTCTECGKFLRRDELVEPGDEAGSVRDRCPYDGATVRMTAPLPADGGPLLGFTAPLPPPPSSNRLSLSDWAVLAVAAFEFIGVVVILPLLALAVIATVVTGNLIFVAAWVVFAVLLVATVVIVGPVNN